MLLIPLNLSAPLGSPVITLYQSHAPILQLLCALVLRAVSWELHTIALEWLEPLYHPESLTCLRVFVPLGFLVLWWCLLGRKWWAACKSLGSLPLVLSEKNYYLQDYKNSFLNVRCDSYSRKPCAIRLRLRPEISPTFLHFPPLSTQFLFWAQP